MTWTTWISIGSLFGALSVLLGAFGAHALKTKLSPESLVIFETGVRYQMYHAFALFGVALVASRIDVLSVKVAGYCFIAGILLFSGSLYALVFTGVKTLGMITPVGGILLVLGWLSLAKATFR